nr:fimbrial protein [uncultured Moellerella sp.]
MKLNTALLLISAFAAHSAYAVDGICKYAPDTPAGGTHVVISPADMIRINADEPISLDRPIYTVRSSTVGSPYGYECKDLSTLQSRVLSPVRASWREVDAQRKIYTTDIPGIGVRPRSYNGVGYGQVPAGPVLARPDDNPNKVPFAFWIPASMHYVLEFYKIGDLDLSSNSYPNSKVVIRSGSVANTNLSTFSYLEFIAGEVTIISTPVCKVDSKVHNIDFNTVTPDILAAGVERNLNFQLICKTDYGSYSAVASINAAKRTIDGQYINVEDSNNQISHMGIQIRDKNNRVITVDGNTTETISNIPRNGVANFEWKARLTKLPNGVRPAKGRFNAQAIITLDYK